MNELIERQAAIDALDFEIVHMTAYCDGKNEGNPLAQYNKGLEDGKKQSKHCRAYSPNGRRASGFQTITTLMKCDLYARVAKSRKSCQQSDLQNTNRFGIFARTVVLI